MRSRALALIPVGVVVERRRAKSVWAEFLWRPVSVLAGTPTAAPWTPLDADDTTSFFAGQAVIELHRTETANYRDNLATGRPALWTALRPVASERGPYEILAVTADPAEGEAFTNAGNNLVEAVPMPPDVAEIVAQFIAENHVERPFVKRERDQQTLSHRKAGREREQYVRR